MKLKLLTWNSININDGTSYNAYIPPPQMANQSNNPVLVNRANDYPFLSVAQRNASFITINVVIAPGANINTYRELLKQYFFSDLNKHTLVAQDENDGNRQYYRTGIPISLLQEGGNINSFLINIQTDYPYWQLVTASVDSWDITASGDSDAISNIGNINVPPVFTITPTTTKTSGLKYRRFVSIYNVMDKSFVEPLDITDGGLDVQALIDAGKMQANGDDFLVWKNGDFSDRWLYEMDSDSDPALCWNNYSLLPRHEGITLATFDSDDTTLSFTETRANKLFLQYLKTVNNPILQIEDEICTFPNGTINTIEYTISTILRGQKNTTAVSHVASSVVRHIEHDLYILYGDSDLGTPDINDDTKPIFDLLSSNLSWTYTNYFSTISNRSGMWKPEVLQTRTALSYTFTDSDPMAEADPSNVLGLAEIGTQSALQPLAETATLDWLFSHPSGNTNVAYDANIYNTGSWPAVVGLQYLKPNTTWITAQNEVAPSTTQVWEAVTSRNVSLGGTYETIRFVIDGTLNSTANEQAMAAFRNVVLSFDSDNIPVIALETEQAINFFDFKLTNSTTGEYIKVKCPCPLNSPLTIDCEQRKAYLADGGIVNVEFSNDRENWLDLRPGTNNLQYDDTGTVAVHVNITHRDRTL